MIDNDAWVTQAWSDHHGFLLDVAYRLLGSYSEAEDLVQEAFTRLLRSDLDPIEDVRAWLVVVVSRLCLDQLRSARIRREAYVGPWFPEPLIHSDEMSDPADIVTMDESVRMGAPHRAGANVARRARRLRAPRRVRLSIREGRAHGQEVTGGVPATRQSGTTAHQRRGSRSTVRDRSARAAAGRRCVHRRLCGRGPQGPPSAARSISRRMG